MLTFQAFGLSDEMLKSIEEIGFVNPTPIQEKIIPLIFSTDDDIVGLAQTGTGKTAAFGLPIIEQVDISNQSTQALILAPTRELCIQITKDLKNYSKYISGINITAVYGGASIDTQIRALKKGAHIIAATPGRMLDLINRRVANIQNIQTVILDEADEMLNMGFRDELNGILEITPKQRRTLLFSATMPDEVANIAKKYMHNPKKITMGMQNAGADNIRHIYYQVHAKDRYLALKRVADYNPDIYGLVFCRTRMETKEVAEKLIKDGYSADALHGDLSQAQRDYVMNKFRDKSIQMLVATDVAARGIDVNDITHVINYNLPEENDIYTHRSGRTGRAGKSGIAISIVNYREIKRIPQIERMLKQKFEKMPVPNGEDICNKQLFSLINKMQTVSIDEKQIEPFMGAVNKMLEWLPKEEIIKRFVSLEFNRFLDYYKNAPDINSKDENRSDRKSGKQNGKTRSRSRGSFERFFINLGNKDGIQPKNIIGMINENTRDRDISVGEIEIKDSFSFFEVDENYSELILISFENVVYKRRPVRVEIADRKPDRKPRGSKDKFPDRKKKSGKSKKRNKQD